MTTQFTYSVLDLERTVSDGCVLQVLFLVEATDGVYKVGTRGNLVLMPPEVDLVPFCDLTQGLVIDWVKDVLGDEKLTEIRASLEGQLQEQRQPTKASGVPWQVAT